MHWEDFEYSCKEGDFSFYLEHRMTKPGEIRNNTQGISYVFPTFSCYRKSENSQTECIGIIVPERFSLEGSTFTGLEISSVSQWGTKLWYYQDTKGLLLHTPKKQEGYYSDGSFQKCFRWLRENAK